MESGTLGVECLSGLARLIEVYDPVREVLWRGNDGAPGAAPLEAGEPDLGHTPALHHVEVLLRNAVDTAGRRGGCAADTWLEDSAILNDAARRRVRETTA